MTRLSWGELPGWVREEAEERLGGHVVRAVSQESGYSPGVAARVVLDSGERAFVKAVAAELNPDSPDMYRAEARVVAALPRDAPAPRLLWDFDRQGWVVLAFEDIEGVMPALPWSPDELERVLVTLERLADSLTPAPIDVPSVAERFGEEFLGWRRLAAATDGLDPWMERHLDVLVDLERQWGEAAGGVTLAHGDMRADNLLLTSDRVVVVDWPWACTAAPWFDLLTMVPSIRAEGGPPPEELFDRHPLGRTADPKAVTAVLTAITGYFIWQSRQPAPQGIPGVRKFQAELGAIALDWLKQR